MCQNDQLICFRAGLLRIEDIYTVKLGVYNVCKDELSQGEYKTKHVQLHEKYFEESPYYDIAVINLDGDTEDYVPVCLPNAGRNFVCDTFSKIITC